MTIANKLMANITPDSQLSTYECLHQMLNGNHTKHEDNDSLQVSPNLNNENMEPSMEDCHIIPKSYEDSPSQSSTQRQKRCTSEEAQLH
ncbi:hypothetical protein O181_063913 [Austropuccinia psidii MF-1]|uniref:Uncharacterized protein n=1 Tax=Austropuccinia psidii MF-1 TaxID=1389203 RepID=A0A9Q3I121_9BASI|nr:hypothetical protein [Austropuccinia psidii MF-1]